MNSNSRMHTDMAEKHVLMYMYYTYVQISDSVRGRQIGYVNAYKDMLSSIASCRQLTMQARTNNVNISIVLQIIKSTTCFYVDIKMNMIENKFN